MIRVFPRRTKWTPIDDLAFVGDPPLFRPPDQPVRISVTFTWDIPIAKRLLKSWSDHYSGVQVGGPAFDDPGGEFVPGRFLARGRIITSRGCVRRCPWCLVPGREGRIRELPIKDGWDVIDNNLLACSRNHIDRVFDMLERQPEPIKLSGGLDSRLLKKWHVDRIKKLRLKYMFFACDYPGAEVELFDVLDLTEDFSIEKRRCYVMIGFDGESLEQAEKRLRTVYNMGFLPYAMLYRSKQEKARCNEWPREWVELQQFWCQPRLYRGVALCERGHR